MALEAHVGGPVTAKLLDGSVVQLERVTPSMLVELGSFHRAMTGQGASWLTLDECMALVQTIEGMRWLAWRCAVKYQPEYQGEAGRHKFGPLVEDFHLLTSLVAELTAMPEPEDGADPPEGAEAGTT
jgi:hypothetical protein